MDGKSAICEHSVNFSGGSVQLSLRFNFCVYLICWDLISTRCLIKHITVDFQFDRSLLIYAIVMSPPPLHTFGFLKTTHPAICIVCLYSYSIILFIRLHL